MLLEYVTFTFAVQRRESRFAVIGFLRVLIHADERSSSLMRQRAFSGCTLVVPKRGSKLSKLPCAIYRIGYCGPLGQND